MIQFAEELAATVDYKQHLLNLLSDVAGCETIEDACVLFDGFLRHLNCQLLSVKFHDVENVMAPIRPFSAYPPGMRRFRGSADYQHGCPFNREAQLRLRPFSLASIDRSKYKDLKDRQFFKELEKSGHANIAILPVIIGRGVSLITIGLNDQPFEGRIRMSTADAAAHIVAAVVARFPQVANLFEKKLLNPFEVKILTFACNGKSDTEIGQRLQLSAQTIAKFKQNIRSKLGARNDAEMIFRAISTGEIYCGFSNGLALRNDGDTP